MLYFSRPVYRSIAANALANLGKNWDALTFFEQESAVLKAQEAHRVVVSGGYKDKDMNPVDLAYVNAVRGYIADLQRPPAPVEATVEDPAISAESLPVVKVEPAPKRAKKK